jgi:hypothetical protein
MRASPHIVDRGLSVCGRGHFRPRVHDAAVEGGVVNINRLRPKPAEDLMFWLSDLIHDAVRDVEQAGLAPRKIKLMLTLIAHQLPTAGIIDLPVSSGQTVVAAPMTTSEWLKLLSGYASQIEKLRAENEEAWESIEMACQGGPDDCDCCGCQYAAEVRGREDGASL